MSPRGRRSSPTTQLVEYLNCSDNWRDLKDLPTLTKARLRRAQNSVKRSKDNNDLLEFIGDRVVNLACSLIVDKVKESSDHHMFVGRVLSNNDTLGRIAYQLDLHKDAHLDQRDEVDVTEWSPRHTISPPKALADLFESYAGAVYEEHGWERVMDWLKQIFTPLLKAATEDFDRRSDTGRHFFDSWQSADQELQDYQERILDYLEFKSKFLTEAAQSALDALPASTQFIFSKDGSLGIDADKAELGSHLVNFWICKIFIRVYPHLHQATHKGAHLITWVTELVVSTWTFGYLGSLLALSSFFDVEDVDYNSIQQIVSPRSADASPQSREALYRDKLSLALKAAIGWYHTKDPQTADKWGESWFKFIVIRAHDIIAEDPNYQPSLPSGAGDTLSIHAAAVAAANSKPASTCTVITDLASGLEAITINDKSDSTSAQDEDVVIITRTQNSDLTKFRPVSRSSAGGKTLKARASGSPALPPEKCKEGRTSSPKGIEETKALLSIDEKLVAAFKDIKLNADANNKVVTATTTTEGKKIQVKLTSTTTFNHLEEANPTKVAAGSGKKIIPTEDIRKASSKWKPIGRAEDV